MYLGIDVGKKSADWKITTNRKNYYGGAVLLTDLAALIVRRKVKVVAMEWTGRLAEPWANLAKASGCEVFIIHPGTRRGYTTLSGQTSKTDPWDAHTIAKVLSIWHDPVQRESLGIAENTFTSYDTIGPAWELRGLMADYDALMDTRKQARQRVEVYKHIGADKRAKLWQMAADSDLPALALDTARDYALRYYRAEYEALTSIPGVGDVLAIWMLATLMPIERFDEGGTTAKALDNIKRYLGMHPTRRQSGVSLDESTKTKSGHRHIRGLIYVCSMAVSTGKTETAMSVMYQREVARGRSGRRALLRVGHWYLRVMVALMRDPKPYQDKSTGRTSRTTTALKARIPTNLVPQKEAGDALGITRQRVDGLRRTGKLKTETYDGRWYVLRTSLDELVARRAGETPVNTDGKPVGKPGRPKKTAASKEAATNDTK
jgi:transposase